MAEGEDILSKPLKISDLDVVLEKLLDAQNSSYQIGLKFKIDPPMLDAIHVRETVSQRCLMHVLREILNREPPPTWNLFIEALRSKLINLPRLATELESDLLQTPKDKLPTVEALQKQIREMKQKEQDYQDEILSLNLQIKVHQNEICTLQAGSQAMELDLNNMTGSLHQANEQIVLQQHMYREVKEENSELTTKLQQTEEEMSERLEKKNKSIRDLHKIIDTTKEEMLKQHTRLEERLEEKDRAYASLEAVMQQTREEMQERLEEKDRAYESLETVLQQTREEMQGRLGGKDRAYESLETVLQQTREEMQGRLGGKDRAYESLETELQQTKEEMQERLGGKDRAYDSVKTELQQTKEEMREKLEQKNKSIRDLNLMLDSTKENVQSIQTCLEEKDSKINNLQVALENSRELSMFRPVLHGGRNAPEIMYRGATAVHENTAYLRLVNSNKIYAYQKVLGRETWWTSLPPSPYWNSGLAVVKSLLTSVGGYVAGGSTENANLLSLKNEGGKIQWQAIFPSMPTQRSRVACVTTPETLVVAGGFARGRQLDTVEVMNIGNLEWTTVCPLPQLWSDISAVYSRGTIYVAGGVLGSTASKALISCPLSRLTTGRQHIWKEISCLPVTHSTLASFNGYLVGVGGWNPLKIPTAEITVYNPLTDSWSVLTHMSMRRSMCLAFTLANGKLVVVGGRTRSNDPTNHVEIFETKATA